VRGQRALVREVIRGARKRVDGSHVMSQGPRQQERRDREVFVVRPGDPFAGRVRLVEVCHHSVSGTPCRWLTARAITSRSTGDSNDDDALHLVVTQAHDASFRPAADVLAT
jgi:hypothetical protein